MEYNGWIEIGMAVLWFGLRKLWLKLKYITPGRTKADEKKIPLVIFSDGRQYWQYFEPICRELDSRFFDVTYLTAAPDDLALSAAIPHLHAEFVGRGNKAFARMNFLRATLVLSITPGLDVYQWKRSKDVNYYIHILHAISATGYTFFGIDFYDALILSAEFQKEEIRELERIREEPEKEIVLAGLPYWDEMEKKNVETGAVQDHETTVLLVPSWRELGLLSRYGSKLIDILLDTGYHIIIRLLSLILPLYLMNP